MVKVKTREMVERLPLETVVGSTTKKDGLLPPILSSCTWLLAAKQLCFNKYACLNTAYTTSTTDRLVQRQTEWRGEHQGLKNFGYPVR